MLKLFFGKVVYSLAQGAVIYAQNVLDGESGENKKKVAIAYIMEKLPIWQSLKPLIYRFIADLVDEAIEIAVKKFKNG